MFSNVQYSELNIPFSKVFLLHSCNFNAYCLFSLVNTVVYCIPAHWLWSPKGFLYQLGVVDIAGSGGVHLVGGSSGECLDSQNLPKLLKIVFVLMSDEWEVVYLDTSSSVAFVAAIMLGPRLGRWDSNVPPPMGSPTNALIGLFMLWWGWLAFNSGR